MSTQPVCLTLCPALTNLFNNLYERLRCNSISLYWSYLANLCLVHPVRVIKCLDASFKDKLSGDGGLLSRYLGDFGLVSLTWVTISMRYELAKALAKSLL